MFEETKGYLKERRSGVLLLVVLMVMLVALVLQKWYFLYALIGCGLYLESVHIRAILQDILEVMKGR